MDKNSVDQQFTATDLIGKDVYDNGGQKIGQVKDIVLGSSAGSHLAMALGTDSGSSGSSGSSDYGTSGSTGTSSTRGSAAGTTGTGSGSSMANTGGTGSGSANRSGASTGAGSSGMGSSWASQAQGALSGLTSEPAAIVSVGGFMGMGDNMVRVPLSQLNYDQSNQHLTVAISQSELTSLTETTGSRAAE